LGSLFLENHHNSASSRPPKSLNDLKVLWKEFFLIFILYTNFFKRKRKYGQIFYRIRIEEENRRMLRKLGLGNRKTFSYV